MITNDIREAILEGAGVELYPDETTNGWYARVGMTLHRIDGRTAAEVFLKLADILVGDSNVEVS